MTLLTILTLLLRNVSVSKRPLGSSFSSFLVIPNDTTEKDTSL